MVWLHGGGWSTSSGTPPGTEGTELAARGDVVVVTLNHRLGVFGYLDLGTLDPAFADAGNAGVLDMVAALRWVRDNIEAFGGDAGNVTLFGQSGGAAKVTALLGLPAAQGLFQKAIVESCSGGLRVMPQAQAAQLAQTLSGKLGLSRPDPATLQALPMDALIAASRSMAEPFRPVLDHRNFLAIPYDGTPSPLSPDVPVLIGNAATEATQFLVMNKANLEIGLPDICSKLAQFWRVDPARATGIVESFRQQMPASTTHFHLYAQIVTDYMYRRNTMQIAALKATQPAPVHAYVFDWKTPAFGGILLSPHTCEVPFVFGTTRQAAGLVGTGADLPQMTRRVMGAWAAFAHTGDPNSGDLPRWPRFAAPEKLAMLLDDQSHVESDPGGERRRLFEGLPYFEYGGLQVLMRG
jgi:para-nitrobenzyl esterase